MSHITYPFRLTALLIPATLCAADFSGPVVSVLDGDTIEVLHNQRPERIRLSGIHCPAMRERPAMLLIPPGQIDDALCSNEKVVD